MVPRHPYISTTTIQLRLMAYPNKSDERIYDHSRLKNANLIAGR